MGFFSRIRGNLIKWWRLTILPVFHINNNNPDEVKEQIKGMKSGTPDASPKQADSDTAVRAVVNQPAAMEETAKKMNLGESELDILARLDKERQEEALRKQREIDSARQKAKEQERIAAIMNANKVDLNSFIEEGKANKAKDDEAAKKEEEMRRAQEIIDRLNREAAEDEAKKQAEIAAAKKQAEETFGN